jgi:hypothetical protein
VRRLARARRVPGVMNKLEAEFEQLFLMQKPHGYEEWTFRLGPDCRFTPDFWSQEEDDSITISEVKGHWKDDAKVKMRVACERYPLLRWEAWTKVNKIWTRQKFGLEDAA